MKVMLVTPYMKPTPTRWIPLGLAYMSSSLSQKGHQTKVHDRFLYSKTLKDKDDLNRALKSDVLAFNPDIVGFSTVSPSIYDTVEAVEFLRSFYKGVIVAGGHHATAMPSYTLKKIPGIDYIVAGEGEVSLSMLAEGIKPGLIPGIYTRKSTPDSFVKTDIPILDNLAMPDYKVFDMDYYTSHDSHTIRGYYRKTAEILTSRGCNNNCSFCSEKLTYGRGVRFHSSDYVIENIERLLSDYDIDGLYLHDNDFLISREHAESICKKIISRGINKKLQWCVQAGTNRIDDEILSLMSKAGCIKIEFGMESAMDKHLKTINKHRTIGMNEKVIRMCDKHDIRIHAYFMTGFPNESLSDMDNTLTWINKHKPHTFQLSQTNIYPGTLLYEKEGHLFFENNDWTREAIEEYFETDHLSPINPKLRMNWYKKKYKPFYSLYNKKAILKSNSLNEIIRMLVSKRI